MSLRTGLVERLTKAVETRGYTPDQVAQRAGLKTPRTVQRVLSGETCSLETLDAIAQGLRIDLLDCGCPATEQKSAKESKREQEPISDRPVVGWRQAALVLEVSVWTLRRHRRALGACRGKPWWPSPKACRAWWERVTAGEEG